MRREPTDAEARMWKLLRDHRLANIKFRRQVPFRSFILDFVCFERRLVIEIDGSQHALFRERCCERLCVDGRGLQGSTLLE
jgi:very-short-patch-repair endonuclease